MYLKQHLQQAIRPMSGEDIIVGGPSNLRSDPTQKIILKLNRKLNSAETTKLTSALS